MIPPNLKKYIDLVHSPRSESSYYIFPGVCYHEIPNRPYEFIFVDGPGTTAPSDGTKACDIDLINLVKKSEVPIYAMLETRVPTCYVFQKVFGNQKVKFDVIKILGLVGPCVKEDLRVTDGSNSFFHSFSLVGNTKLDLKMVARKI